MWRLAADVGIDDQTATQGWEQYRSLVEQSMTTEVGQADVHALHGVHELVSALRADSNYALALVTGNIRRVAYHKLSMAMLDGVFHHGAFGCEHANRSLLPPLALTRVNEALQTTYSAADCIVIGDAPNDVRCAVDNGMHAIAVATGPVTIDRLLVTEAAVVLESFGDVDAALRAIASLRS